MEIVCLCGTKLNISIDASNSITCFKCCKMYSFNSFNNSLTVSKKYMSTKEYMKLYYKNNKNHLDKKNIFNAKLRKQREKQNN